MNRALLVGIGNYNTNETGWSKIHGDDDVSLLFSALQNNGVDRTDIWTLRNEAATKSRIVLKLQQLADICKRGDNVFFLFSGHGQLVRNYNNDQENNGLDESIIPCDAFKTGRFTCNGQPYHGQNHLIDDELAPLLNEIKIKIGPRGTLFVAIDACYSEGMEQGNDETFSPDDMEIMGPSRGTADVFKPKSSHYLKNIPLPPTHFSKGGKMIVVSACKKNERNFEYKFPNSNRVVGSLSHCIALLLEKDMDFDRWARYFEGKEYKGKRMFIQAQHPTITVYK